MTEEKKVNKSVSNKKDTKSIVKPQNNKKERKLTLFEIADALICSPHEISAIFISNGISLTEKIELTKFKKLME